MVLLIVLDDAVVLLSVSLFVERHIAGCHKKQSQNQPKSDNSEWKISAENRVDNS